jgi:hypothetical protein
VPAAEVHAASNPIYYQHGGAAPTGGSRYPTQRFSECVQQSCGAHPSEAAAAGIPTTDSAHRPPLCMYAGDARIMLGSDSELPHSAYVTTLGGEAMCST